MRAVLFAVAMTLWTGPGAADRLLLAVTTSFQNSGLADALLPHIEADTGLDLRLLVVGTGQALRLGAAGDVDAVLVHAPEAEAAFVAAGHGTHRRRIMHNDFVLVGPADDPAGIASAQDAAAALARIAGAGAPFVSRGDDSGTHQRERALWTKADLAPDGPWYREVGAGMGAALNTATALGAYVLTDRASWLNFGNRDGMALLFQGDPALFNQYSYIPVNPQRHAHVRAAAARRLETWLTSEAARALIDGYTVAGEAPFTANPAPLPE